MNLGELDWQLVFSLVAAARANGALPSPEEMIKTLSGEAFTEWGIQNFLENDFFSWILRARAINGN